MWWFGVVRCHLRSLEIAPFDRAHTSSYKCSIVTMSLSCTVLRYGEILVENRRLNLPHLYLAPPLGVLPSEFRRNLWLQKTTVPSWDIVWRSLHDLMFSRFGTVLACDKRTYIRTDEQTGTRRQHIPH